LTGRRPTGEELERAVRWSLLPGVTLAQASRLAGVPLAALKRARKESAVRLTRDDLVLAGLTRNGERSEGPVGDPAALASFSDYVNHDGSTAAEVERDLQRLAAAGQISVENGRFRLLRRWP
jgi:hypothetical protein